ncbi:MAG: type IV pilus modification PilV family protein [Arenimonas sp.]
MKTPNKFAAQNGFSLLEVLLAAAILSFGLLALASLQLSLFRSSSDTKAQSVALGLAKEQIETIKTYTTVTQSTACAANSTSYQCIAPQAKPVADNVLDVNGSLGGVNYKRWWNVNRFVNTGTNYVGTSAANVTATDAAVTTAHAGYVTGKDFKTITMFVSYVDVKGVEKVLRVEDSISRIAPIDSAAIAKQKVGNSPRPAQAVISTSGLQFAIPTGSGSSTAASNPTPEIYGSTVSTRFTVQTYAALAGGLAVAQSEVETILMGCKCSYGTKPAAVSNVFGYRPTYWDGTRYVIPTKAKFKAMAGESATAPLQDKTCDICCRDHHDPDNLASDAPRFDRWRDIGSTHDHDHYALTDLATVVDPAASPGNYDEACRVIRVDGIYRVAADVRNDYFGLVETINSGDDPLPSPTAITNYTDFVLDYMHDRYSNNAVSSSYNTPLATSTYETTYSLNAPASIDIRTANDKKWLHARSLLIDYLEPAAVKKIIAARESCSPNSTQAERNACVLPYLPFTSVNTTELAKWQNGPVTTASTQITVADADFGSVVCAPNTLCDPIRGYVQPGSSPTAFAVPDIQTLTRRSNSGLIKINGPINPQEVPAVYPTASPYYDVQNFRIRASVPNTGTGGTFNITMSSYTFSASNPLTSFIVDGYAPRNCVTTPTRYTCVSAALGPATEVRLSHYNYEDTANATFGPGYIDCTKSNGSGAQAIYVTKTNRRRCSNWSVVSASTGSTVGVVGSPVDDGKGNTSTSPEYTPIDFSTILTGETVTVLMQRDADTFAQPSCIYNGSSPSTNDVVWLDPCL